MSSLGIATPPHNPRDASNVDPLEVAKFSAAAHTWWDLEGQFRPLHRINPLRLDWIRRYVNPTGLCALDVGCGGGILSDALAWAGANVTGIDRSTEALKVAKLHALEVQTPQVRYQEISAEALAQEMPGRFDLVTCMEMLEHVPDPASIVQACHDLVKPGGWVFFSTIARTPKAFLTAIVGAEYVLNLVPPGTHEYAKLIRPSELAAWTRAARLDIKGNTGLHYNPITDRFWLAPDISANYMVVTQRPLV